MKTGSYAMRTAGFVALNQGNVHNCYVDAKVKGKENVAGFVFENSGNLSYSLTLGKTEGKENVAAFCGINRGKLNAAGYLYEVKAADMEKKPEQIGALKSYIDKGCCLLYTSLEEHLRALGFEAEWLIKGNELELDRERCRKDFGDAQDVIEISSSEQLTALANAIASGDGAAAAGHYRLTEDINLKGASVLPIGVSESLPFTGIFDGAGHKIHNFKVTAKGTECAGLFGYIKNGTVANLDVDCVVNAGGGMFTGAMCGVNGGTIVNCCVLAKVGAYKNCGGFCGKNYGEIGYCAFIGAVTLVIPFLFYLAPTLIIALLLIVIGLLLLIGRMNDSPYQPIVVDPGSAPVIENEPVLKPTEGTSLISLNLNCEVYVNVEPDPTSGRQVGVIDCHNPLRSTENIVLRVLISDAELIAHGYTTAGMSTADYAARAAEPGYDASTAYQELFRSGLIPIGYNLQMIGISTLQDGTYLPEGDYNMMAVLDPYDPETNEKSIVNAEAPIVVHVIKSAQSENDENSENSENAENGETNE